MILALDSSTSWLSLAIGIPEHGRVRWLESRTLRGEGKHTAALPVEIDRLLFDAKVSPGQLTGCAVGLGPGSFTGLRLGLATVKGMAYGRQQTVAGVSSLRAMAYQVLSQSPAASPVVSLLDARQGQIYAGVFTGQAAEPLGTEFSVKPAQLAAALGEMLLEAMGEPLLIGEGVQVYRAHLENDFEAAQLAEGPLSPDARAIGDLCFPLPPFSLEALFALEPHYVLPSQAEIRFPNGNFKLRPSE